MVSPISEQARLVAFQNRILAITRALPTKLYLSGRAAASRGYLNHRLTYEMLFACNEQGEFNLWADQIVGGVLKPSDWRTKLAVREPCRLVMMVQQEDMTIELTLVNDGPLHLGNMLMHPELGLLDSPENIAALAIVSIVNNAEPGDLADLLGLCVRHSLDLESLLSRPESKAAGVFPPDLARALHMAGNRDWDMVRWVHRPPLDMYLSQLKQLGTRLLALDTTELKPPVPTRKVIEPQSLAARSSFIDRSKLVHSDIESSVPFTQLSAANPGTDPRTHSPENYSTPLQAEQPAPMDPEPPIVKRGTGILNYYRAMKAAGFEEFLDPDSEDTAMPDSPVPAANMIPQHSPFLRPLPEMADPTPLASEPVRPPPAKAAPPPPKVEPQPLPGHHWSPTVVTGSMLPKPHPTAAPSPALSSPADGVPGSDSLPSRVFKVPVNLSPSDKRSETRRRISYYVPVIDMDSGESIGYLSDISKHGLCLDCQGTLIRGSKRRLRIDLPPELGPKPHITFSAEVRWSRVDPTDPNAYNAGLEVVSIASEDARSFLKILDKFSYEKNTD